MLWCGCKFSAVQRNISFIPWRCVAWHVLPFTLVWYFFSYCTYTFFHLIFFCGSIYFFCYYLCDFLLFLLDSMIFMFMFIIPSLYWDRLFTKKNSFDHYLVFVSVLDIRWITEVKTSTSVSPISFDSLFWWLRFFCWQVITLLKLACLGFLLHTCCSPPYKEKINTTTKGNKMKKKWENNNLRNVKQR